MSKYIITQNIPERFIGRILAKSAHFSTLIGLNNVPWVKSWCRDFQGAEFYRLSIKAGEGRSVLMGEWDEGRKWHIIGFINSETVDFLNTHKPIHAPQLKPLVKAVRLAMKA